ncbi:uncharacterized protein EAE97_004263 [Botrytis byssoidea]|uniref:Thiol methyltransferase n=1 Tax=Botrytis byssoidea TaxID=139641 RepID=A0A9P5M7I6_9HELO|nr:uncharacterized protein EAE97_004263 [Botrytis byssoidea]KAF7947014.1 hypothetical protein EAE97_004263 [Botrytis byssoidea]
MNAPLTSPTRTTSSATYFQSFPTGPSKSSTSSSSSSGPTSAPQPPAPQAPQRSSSQDETSPFLKDFNLVAEAAKRAQMACLMRDMEGCGL